MAHSPRSPETDDEAPMPVWVYVAGVAVIVLALAPEIVKMLDAEKATPTGR